MTLFFLFLLLQNSPKVVCKFAKKKKKEQLSQKKKIHAVNDDDDDDDVDDNEISSKNEKKNLIKKMYSELIFAFKNLCITYCQSHGRFFVSKNKSFFKIRLHFFKIMSSDSIQNSWKITFHKHNKINN